MGTSEELFLALSEQVILAERFRNEFDLFWKNEVGRRGGLSMAYLIRHSTLLSSFENLLFLFCSKEIWAYGGIGAKAANKEVNGPVYLLSHGDPIERMKMLCLQYDKEIIAILNLFDLPEERDFLVNELKNIIKINALALKNFNPVLINV